MSMLKVGSAVKLNTGAIRGITDTANQALVRTAEALHDAVVKAQVVPFKTGSLQNASTRIDTADSAAGRVALVSSTPYARRLYFHPEYHFSKSGNAKAQGRWYRQWLPGGSQDDFAREEFIRFYRKEAP